MNSLYESIISHELVESNGLTENLGPMNLMVDTLDEYYEAVRKRTTAIALVSPILKDLALIQYNVFVKKRQQTMIESAKKCINTFFDIEYQSIDRARFITGMIMNTAELEHDSLSDLIDYQRISVNRLPLALSRAISRNIINIKRDCGDDNDVRISMLKLYCNEFGDKNIHYLQECILEAKGE